MGGPQAVQVEDAAQIRYPLGTMSNTPFDISIILPCLNEEATVGLCVEHTLAVLAAHGISGEVLVADNGSTDASARVAAAAGARVVNVPRGGYGNALRAGMEAAAAPWLLFFDADLSYDPDEIPRYVEALRAGADMVMGSRLRGHIDTGAMPRLHRRFGTPLLTLAARMLFGSRISDINCGMRALTKTAYQRLDLHAEGMEFASEMVVKAAQAGLKVAEIPIVFHVDQRGRQPHLRSFRDGWRHLQLMLHFAPLWMFLAPGLLLCGFGCAVILGALPAEPALAALMGFVAAHGAVILGMQVILIGMIAQGRVKYSKFLSRPESKLMQLVRVWLVVENGLVIGLVLAGAGFAVAMAVALGAAWPVLSAVQWLAAGSVVFVVGLQVVFTCLVMGLFGMRMAEDRLPAGESATFRETD